MSTTPKIRNGPHFHQHDPRDERAEDRGVADALAHARRRDVLVDQVTGVALVAARAAEPLADHGGRGVHASRHADGLAVHDAASVRGLQFGTTPPQFLTILR